MWGASSYPYPVPGHVPVAGDRDRPDPFAEPAAPVEILEEVDAADVHLRSCDSVQGYTIDATDGEIGHVHDFLIEDETWALRYAVVSTSRWWFGNKVLISPSWIEAFSWAESKAVVNMTRDAIKNAPPSDPGTVLECDRETALHEHYGRRMY